MCLQPQLQYSGTISWVRFDMQILSGKGRCNTAMSDIETLQKVDKVINGLRCGDKIVVHCHAGCHRTGTFIYILLRRFGLSPSKSIEGLKATRLQTYNEIVWKNGDRPSLADKAEAVFQQMFLPPGQF